MLASKIIAIMMNLDEFLCYEMCFTHLITQSSKCILIIILRRINKINTVKSTFRGLIMLNPGSMHDIFRFRARNVVLTSNSKSLWAILIQMHLNEIGYKGWKPFI